MNRDSLRGLFILFRLLPLPSSERLSSRVTFFTEHRGQELDQFTIGNDPLFQRQQIKLVEEVVNNKT